MLSTSLTETGTEVTENVTNVAPAGTRTLAGRLILASPPVRVTVAPDGPAGPDKVTLPIEETPPTIDAGEKVKLATGVGFRVKVAVALELPDAAVRVSTVNAVRADEVIAKLAAVAPLATVTVAGYDTEESPPDKFTTKPLAGAGEANVTVPVTTVDAPPTIIPGEIVRVEMDELESLFTKPWKLKDPQPVTKSHPAWAEEVVESGKVPLFPVRTSKKTEELPLNE